MADYTAYFAVAELPQHCTPTTGPLVWFSTFIGICVPTPQAAISTALGCMSIFSWLCAQMPQLIKNYKIKSTAGLSMYFLAEWLLGDITNLTGCILTHQAGWQITVASYYVFVDTCLMIQYFWYRRLRSKFDDGSIHSRSSSLDDVDDDMINSLSPINSNFVEERDDVSKNVEPSQSKPLLSSSSQGTKFIPVNYEKRQPFAVDELSCSNKEGRTWFATPSPRTMMHVATLSTLVSRAVAAPMPASALSEPIYTRIVFERELNTLEYIGTVVSWSSTFLYLGSRFPQLYRNWRRQSTAGLSPFMFFAAFCGNFFYTSSLFTSPNAWNDFGPYGGHGWSGPDGSKQGAWILNTAPFFLGAFGCLGLDALIGIQFLLYGEREAKLVKVRDGRGHSHWERVHGWMRGWIPTLSREKVVDLAESQRLLSESREMERDLNRSGYSTI